MNPEMVFKFTDLAHKRFFFRKQLQKAFWGVDQKMDYNQL